MAYSNFIDFVNATNQTVTDTYIYLGNPPPEGYQSQKGAAIFNFICGIIFLSLLLSSIISALRKNMKTLFISFAGALFLTLIVFVVNDFFLY